MKKVLSINGGGIKDLSYLYNMLKIANYYFEKNIEFLDIFDVFSGVSSGAIIASAFAVREIIISDLQESSDYKNFLNFWNNKIPQNNSLFIIQFLIYVYQTKINQIFQQNFKNKIGLNGIIFAKYSDNKKNLFKQYFNYSLDDIPNNRTLIIKTYNLQLISFSIYTNSPLLQNLPNKFNGNNITKTLFEIINYSSDAPTFFDNITTQIDGGTIINDALIPVLILFNDEQTKIINFSPIISAESAPQFFNGILGWIFPLITVLRKYSLSITNDIIKFIKKDNVYFQKFPIEQFVIDSISPSDISQLSIIGKNKDITDAIKFINSL